MATYYKVTTQSDPLRLHYKCDLSEETVIARMPKGTVVTANFTLMPDNGYIAVNYGSQSGFAYAQYLTLCDANGNIIEEQKKKNEKENTQETITPADEEGTSKILVTGIAVAALGGLAFLFL